MHFKMMALAGVLIAVALYTEHYTAAVVIGAVYLIVFFLNRIEIKLNRLLDHYGIVVSEKELHD